MKSVVIIGAGIAGLCCAIQLTKLNYKCTILESTNKVGGRVQSDTSNGFILDHGFQVLQTAYPKAKLFLDYDKLNLQSLDPVVLVYSEGKTHKFYNPIKQKTKILHSIFSRVGNLQDKSLMFNLLKTNQNKSIDEIFLEPETTTSTALDEAGFSYEIIENFFRPLLAGTFLENELNTTSRMFNFVYKIFSSGNIAIPYGGMGAIGEYLESQLPLNTIRFGHKVVKLNKNKIILDNGDIIQSDLIVLATDADTTSNLLNIKKNVEWNSTTCYYFSAKKPPYRSKAVLLNGDLGPINHIFVPTNVSSNYSSDDKSLISVTVVGEKIPEEDILENLFQLFGEETKTWEHIKTYYIKKALPKMLPDHKPMESKIGEYYICGDHTTHSSLQGAIQSGQEIALQISQSENN